MRRKGERPLPVYLDSWSDSHPVARSIATGTWWFQAWLTQKATPVDRLSRTTGIPQQRLLTLCQRDRVSLAEIDALARAWCVSAGDLKASIPAELVVE